jgi:hypothetical protein
LYFSKFPANSKCPAKFVTIGTRDRPAFSSYDGGSPSSNILYLPGLEHCTFKKSSILIVKWSGRVLGGIGMGLTFSITSVYLMDISSPAYRGILGVFPPLLTQVWEILQLWEILEISPSLLTQVWEILQLWEILEISPSLLTQVWEIHQVWEILGIFPPLLTQV